METDQKTQQAEEQPQTGYNRWLPYDNKVTFVQFITFLLCIFFPISFVVFISSGQTFVLTEIIGERENRGSLTSILGIADQIVSLIMVAVWGIVSDRLSRKVVFVACFLITGISIIIFPFCKNVYPQLIIVRIIFAFGSSGLLSMLTAALSDMRGTRHHGKLTGLVGLMSGLGALFGAMVWLRLLSVFQGKMSHTLPFIIVGVVSIVWGIFVFFFYQSPRIERINEEVAPLTNIKTHTLRFLRALKLGFTRPLVGLGYIGGLAARGDTLILTTFITLWVTVYFEKQGLCAPSGQNDIIKETCRPAFTSASALSGVGQALAIVGAPFFGIALDYISSVYVLFFSCILAFIGYFGLAGQSTPMSKISFVYISMIGLTEIGTIICSMKVLSDGENIDKHERGNVSGVYSFFGSIGILIGTGVGGYMFDNYGGTSPFYLVGSAHVLLAVLTLIVIVYTKFIRK